MINSITIEGISKEFNNKRGIFDIKLDVEKGDIFGFLGPNGAGKTTTMKIMTGLLSPDKGDVKIEGFSVLNNYEKAMQNVGCIIENASLFSYLTAYEHLKLGARFYKNVNDARINECLMMTGMLKYRDEKIKNYSMGMRQRISLSLAFLSNPKVLILDEPLNGMDVEGMVEMRSLILSFAKENKTTFFISSHLIHDIELTCNKIAILYKGRLLGTDTVENILNNYSSLESYYLSEVDHCVKS